MSSTTLTPVASDLVPRSPITGYGWAWLAGLGVLFFLVFKVILVKSFQFALDDADWSHALIVPLISGYFVYQHRAELAATPARPCWWGLAILLAGLVFHAFWIFPGRNHMFQGYSMILALFGLVLFVMGLRAMRYLWVPVLYLGFAIKVSDAVWELIAFKLQMIAARGAEVLINFFGAAIDLEAEVRGSILGLTYQGSVLEPLEVAQACAGLRMLMAFIALGAAVAFLAKRPWWQRLAVLLSTVPIAVFINVVRVAVLGFIHPFDSDLSGGDFHTVVGMLMLIPAAGLFLLLGWLLDKIFVIEETVEPGDADRLAPPIPASSAPAPSGAALLPLTGGGAVWGAAATLALGGAYTMGLNWLRPDVLSLVAPWVAGVLAVLLTGVTLALAVGLMPMLRRLSGGPGGGGGRGRWLALGVVGGVLLTTWLGQTAVIAQTRTVMFKDAVPLRHELFRLPKQVDAWRLARVAPPLPDAVVKELGTEDYVTMFYEDADWPRNEPGRFVTLHVAYYTGMIDTVPHVPDRCFVGGGMTQVGGGLTRLSFDFVGARPDPETGGVLAPSRLGPPADARVPETAFDVRRSSFTTPQDPDAPLHEYWFFVANGKFLSTAEAVRINAFNMTDKYSYYCKVQVRAIGVEDPELARERVRAFLTPMLPEIMTCLPDWVDVRAGRYPLDAAAARLD